MRSIRELMTLEGRVAVVTGGAGHIGSALADTVAELGATTVLVDLASSPLDTTAEAIARNRDVTVHTVVADLEQEEDARRIPDRVLAACGRIDILVNAAALVGADELPGWTTPFEEQSAATWRRALEVNLTAVFELVQACTPALRLSGNGTVVNVASTYGIVAPDYSLYRDTTMGNPAAYAASKGGLLQLTRWLATTLAPDIRVNALSPGGVERGQPESFRQRYSERTPLGRMATEEDLKGAIAFLAGDLSRYVTGHNLVVDGGWTAW